MLIDVKCPKCRDVIPVTESAGEQKIDCPGCGKNFSVPGSGKTNPKPDAKEKSKSSRGRDRDSERDRKTSNRRSNRDDDDDDDDGPHRRDDSGAGSGIVGIMVVGSIGLLVLAAGFGFTAYLIFSKEEPEVAQNKPAETRPPNANPPAFRQNGRPDQHNDGAPAQTQPGPKNTNPLPPSDPAQPPAKVEPPAPPVARPAPAVMLPAPAEQIVLGAGGKRLFLFLKANRQVAVFDPVEKKVVKYLSVNDDDVILTAGLDHLLVGYPKTNRIERYGLAAYEMEKYLDVPSKWPLRAIAMGAASTGPLLAATGRFPTGEELFLIDVARMVRYPNTVIRNPGVFPDEKLRMWASHDGRTFTATSEGLSKPTGYQLRAAGGWNVAPSPCNPPLLGADGETVFGGGVIATIAGAAVGEKREERGKGVWYLPAAQGPFFLSLNERTFGAWPNEKKWPQLQVHAGRDQRPLFAFHELPETKEFVDFFFGKTKPLDQHVFFFPFLNTLAILPTTRDRIHVRTLDMKAELAKTTTEYLVAVSRPPPSVKAGQTFTYKPEIWSKKGDVKLRLDANPPGMKLDDDTLTWDVPAKFNGASASVILTVSDASGKEMFHSFEIAVLPAK